MTGVQHISTERTRQKEKEGWSAEHDDSHANDELTLAAVSYALVGCARLSHVAYSAWPFDSEWFKYSAKNGKPETIRGRIRDLTKAGALIAAEIDRLQRLKEQEESK